MAKKYQKPASTGREYVDAAREFNEFTTHMLLKLPEKWKDYILNPLHEAADWIETLTIRANRVYINPNHLSQKELVQAYQLRIELLQEAIREFDVFDRKFIHLTDHIELMQDEMKRMKAILKSMILKELKGLVDSSDTNIQYEVNVRHHLNQVEYTTTLGTKTVKLGMTPKNKEHWIVLSGLAKSEIEKRLASDKKQLSKLTTSQ